MKNDAEKNGLMNVLFQTNFLEHYKYFLVKKKMLDRGGPTLSGRTLMHVFYMLP